MLTAELDIRMDQAMDLVQQTLVDHDFHIVGVCDMRSAFKQKLDEDLKPITVLAVIHLPTALRMLEKKKAASSEVLRPVAVVMSTAGKGRRTRVEGGAPGAGVDDDDTAVRGSWRRVRKNLKAAFRAMERRVVDHPITTETEVVPT